MAAASSAKRRAASSSEQAPDLSITASDEVHLHAAGYNESTKDGLINSMARFRSSPLDFIREVSLYVSGSDWRSYDKIIGQPIFYNGFSDNMKSMVLSNPRLVAKVRELAQKRVDVEAKEGLLGSEQVVGEQDKRNQRRVQIEESLMEVAETLTDNMICKMESKSFIRGAYYLATQLLTRAYHQGRWTPYRGWRVVVTVDVVDSGLLGHLLIAFQAFMSRAKKFCASALSRNKQPRTNNPSSSFHVTEVMLTTSHSKSYATG